MRKIYLSLIIFSCLLLACQKSNTFSTDPNLKLAFSTDTLRFDTVFTTVGSATKQLKVYNRSNNSIKISSIELLGAGQTGFRMNVDGVAATKVTNVELQKNDSLYIFVELTSDPLNSNNPLSITDVIRFTTNGNVQDVNLEAMGQDVYIWKGKTIKNDTTLTGEKPFLIYDSLSVEKGVKLTLAKNTRLYFHKDAGLMLHGNIDAQGTLQEPIVFRGDRFDHILSAVPYDNVPGQWAGVSVDAQSFGNYFGYVKIRNSVQGIYFAPSTPQLLKATLLNTSVQNTTLDAVSATNCAINGSNCLFANAGGSVLKLIGGRYSFLHTTLANYMSWVVRKNAALIIGNVNEKGDAAPLTACLFTNSIIAGSFSTELALQNKLNGQVVNYPFNYLFNNCLIKAKGSDDANFVNTVWNVDPKLKRTSNDNLSYSYDYHLDTGSPAINMGDVSAGTTLPLDLDGVSRIADGKPDIGCYEWIK